MSGYEWVRPVIPADGAMIVDPDTLQLMRFVGGSGWINHRHDVNAGGTEGADDPTPEVFTIAKTGVYSHSVPGVWTSLALAVAAAANLARCDINESWSAGGRVDGYHDWEIVAQVADDLSGSCGVVATVGWEQRGRWDVGSVWRPVSGLGVWDGVRENGVPPAKYLDPETTNDP
jgi:hypothetical protein